MFRRNRSSVVTSRLKAFKTFTDTFSLLSGLKNGWKSYRGTWNSTGTLATSSDIETNYTLAGTKMSSPNITASANVTGGTGIAFWVTDAQSWYATVSYNTTSTDYPCNAGYTTSYSNPPSGSCCSSAFVAQAAQSAYTYSTNATFNAAYSYTYGASYQGAYSYTYAAGYQGAFSYSYSATFNNASSYSYTATYNPASSYTYAATYVPASTYSYNYSASLTTSGGGQTSIGCYRAFSGCPATYNGYAVTETVRPGICGCTAATYSCCSYNAPGTSSYTCPNGGSLSGGICYGATGTSPAYYACPNGGFDTLSGFTCTSTSGAYYSCPSGGSLSGSTCTVSVPASYSCPSGGNLSGTTCTVNVGAYYYCSGVDSLSGSTCTRQVGAYYYCSGSDSLSGTTCTRQVAAYYSCASGTLNGQNCTIQVAAVPAIYGCYTATTPTTVYNYYLRTIKSSGGAVSTVGSDVALSTAPVAIKVVTSGDSITSTAYSNSNMTTLLGTKNDSQPAAAKTGITGIIKSPSNYLQGSTVSNFSATI